MIPDIHNYTTSKRFQEKIPHYLDVVRLMYKLYAEPKIMYAYIYSEAVGYSIDIQDVPRGFTSYELLDYEFLILFNSTYYF